MRDKDISRATGWRENWNLGKIVPEHLNFKGPPLFSGKPRLGRKLTVAYSKNARLALLYCTFFIILLLHSFSLKLE